LRPERRVDDMKGLKLSMAFLFKPSMPTSDMDNLSTAADPTPLSPRPVQVAEPEAEAESSTVTPQDDATLQEFLLKNFLTQESQPETQQIGVEETFPATDNHESTSSNFTLDLPRAEDVDAAIENITTTPAAASQISEAAENSPEIFAAIPEIDAANLLSDLWFQTLRWSCPSPNGPSKKFWPITKSGSILTGRAASARTCAKRGSRASN
jgi:hypothetical protein